MLTARSWYVRLIPVLLRQGFPMRSVPMICLLAASACAEPVPSAVQVNEGALPKQRISPGTCGAADYAALVGQNVAAFTALAHQGPARIIRPGQPVTMDYNPERLNVLLDGDDRIVGLSCG